MRTETTKTHIITRMELAKVLGISDHDVFTEVSWTGGDGASLKVVTRGPKTTEEVNAA